MEPLPAELPPWLPGDDFLLKNAVEAGASLESLAKGAVRFSRRYSLAELRERWRTLLYDPDVPIEASQEMVTCELVSYNGRGIGESSGVRRARKRKTRSICKHVMDANDTVGLEGNMDSVGNGPSIKLKPKDRAKRNTSKPKRLNDYDLT